MVLIYSIQFHHFLFSLTNEDIFGTYQTWWTHLNLFNYLKNKSFGINPYTNLYTTQTLFHINQKNKELFEVSFLFQGSTF